MHGPARAGLVERSCERQPFVIRHELQAEPLMVDPKIAVVALHDGSRLREGLKLALAAPQSAR